MKKEKKTIMITGANKGIGLAVIKSLLKTNPEYQIMMCVRSMERGQGTLIELKKLFPDVESRTTLHNLDISSSQSIDSFIAWLGSSKTRVDCLFNNAGIGDDSKQVTPELIKKIMPTNYYGTIELTEKMLPLLPSEAKIIFVTSVLGTYGYLPEISLKERLEDSKLTRAELRKIVDELCVNVSAKKSPIKDGPFAVYGFSKLILNYYAQILGAEKDILDRKIQVYACTPGWVKTDMGGPSAPLSLEEGTVCPCYLINLPWKFEQNYQGKFFSECKIMKIS